MAVRVGLFLDLRNPPGWRRPWADHYRQTLEFVEEADRLGIGSIWLSEHHFFEDGYLTQPFTMLSAIAARTSTARLGTAIVLAALRHPQHLAEEAILVDLVSGGRLEIGFGAGYRVPEYEAFGRDIGRRYHLTDAAMTEVRRLLSDGVVTPPPLQQPIPLWLGYQGPQGARRAGRLGVGLLSLDRRLLEPYQEGLVAAGLSPDEARMGGRDRHPGGRRPGAGLRDRPSLLRLSGQHLPALRRRGHRAGAAGRPDHREAARAARRSRARSRACASSPPTPPSPPSGPRSKACP